MNKNPSTRLRASLDALFQECLAGLDAGLTPEECLSAWPDRRADLEPMLRQALLLRMAFASAPREDFRARARDRLMFAAGREARQAFAADPDGHFVEATRRRLLNAAGTTTQEALRAVPPPRLPFWINARRRLLDAAASRPAAPRAMAPVLRMSFSAIAVLVIALAVAGLAYFTSQSAQPTVGQELASIEQQLDQIDAGDPEASALLVNLSRRLPEIVDKINTEQSPEATKAAELVDRTKAVAASAPAVRAQVEQQLAPADQKLFALGVQTSISQPSATSGTAAPTKAPSLSTSPTGTAVAKTATKTPATATPVPLGANQARLQLLTDDNEFGVNWSRFSTSNFSIEIPVSGGWQLAGPGFNASGVGALDTSHIILTRGEIVLYINVKSSEIGGVINGLSVVLRTEDGVRSMPVDQLVTLAGGEQALVLSRILDSVQYTAPAPTATPPTRTAPPATATP